GARRASRDPHQASASAERRRNCPEPSVAQRQTACADHELKSHELKKGPYMATLPTFLRRPGLPVHAEPVARPVGVRAERDPHRLRALPNDDIIFYCKKIDNSRLVREADPQGRGACWSAIGGACVLVALLTSAFFPTVATTIAGYRLEALRGEERRLIAERRNLDLQEAELLSPARLDKLAKDNNLVTPLSRQVVHLDAKGDATVAMMQK